MIKILSQEEMIKKMLSDRANYAAIYARRSTLNENGSNDTQILNCTEYAYSKNLFIFKVYSEAISATANNINQREALANMLEDAKKGYFKTVIVTKRDRLARVFDDYLYIKKYLNKYGVSILFENDVECGLADDPMSNFIDNVIMAVADFEPKRIREKCSDGLDRKKAERIYTCSHIPYGFVDPAGTEIIKGRTCTTLKPISEYKKPIENVFKTFINDHNIKSIKSLKEVLISKNLIPKSFDTSKLRDIILKPVYAGLMTVNRNIVYKEGELYDKSTDTELQLYLDYFKPCVNVKPFINDKTWLAAVNKLNSFPKNERTKIIDPLFSNIIYCEHCNSVLKLSSNYYQCKCKKSSISFDSLKYELLNYFNTSDITKNMLYNYISLYEDFLKDEKSKLKNNLKQTIKDLKNKIDSLLDNDFELDKTKLQTDIKELYSEKETLKNSLINLNKKRSSLELTKKDLNKLTNEICKISISDNKILKLFIEIFIEKVILSGKHISFQTKGDKQRSCSNLLEGFD